MRRLQLWRERNVGHKVSGQLRGDGVVRCQIGETPINADGCSHGVMGKVMDTWRETVAIGRNWLYADGPYFLRRKPDSVRLAWHTQWFVPGEGPARQVASIDAKGCVLRPWRRERGPTVYVCPSNQMQHLNGYGDDADQWLEQTMAEVRRYTDRPIKARLKSHMGDGIARRVLEMERIFDDAWAIVTAGSTIGCEALAYGLPVFTDKPCAASPLALSDLSQIEAPREPAEDERRRWAHNLCARQFDSAQLRSGEAWTVMREDIEHMEAACA